MLVKMDGTIESDQMQLIADALVSKNTARQTFRNIIILCARGDTDGSPLSRYTLIVNINAGVAMVHPEPASPS